MQAKELKREAVKVVTASTRAGEADLEDTDQLDTGVGGRQGPPGGAPTQCQH